ncbi:MAG: PAS domain-containing protein [Candidatus Marinimicrobia bacterium]|nr:PAS domain-containing protein [Candidatus Neomarinimicrobiota bacterium]
MSSRYFRGRGFQAFTERVHPEDYEKTMEGMRAVLRGETKLYQVDYRIRTIRGNYLWFMDRGIIMQDDGNGEPLKIRGIVIDLGKESERGTDIDALLSVIYRSGTRAAGKYSFITVCSLCHRIKGKMTSGCIFPKAFRN